MVALDEENHRVTVALIADMQRNDASNAEKTTRILQQNSSESVPLVRTYNEAKRACGKFVVECQKYNEMDTDWGGAATYSFNIALTLAGRLASQSPTPGQPVIDKQMSDYIDRYNKAWSAETAVAERITSALKSCTDAVKVSHPSAGSTKDAGTN